MSQKKPTNFKFLSLALTLLAIFSAGSITSTALADNAARVQGTTISAQELQRLATVMAEIKKFYIKPVSDRDLMDKAISGMLYGLDPHSEYLKKDELETLSMITIGKFGGIGVEVVPNQGLIKVVSPIDDTPAAKAGIKAGDIIIQINNKLVKDMQLNEALQLMRGARGSKVTLTILRRNVPKPLTFTLTRSVIKLKTVKEQTLEPGYGYIRVAFFQENTASDLTKAIHSLQEQSNNHLQGLILDLRNNPGGLMDTAVQVADEFLDAKKLKQNNIIVYTKGNDESSHIVARATPGELLPNVPVVVLINEGSASAAEIVAGALQDYKRALIVGSRSFGKGSVQALLPVDENSAIKLTTALYYTPLGRSIQVKGIEPDILIPEIKISEKNALDGDDLIHIDESSLVAHLQNGDKKAETTDEDKDQTKSEEEMYTSQQNAIEKNNKKAVTLARKDYQLYESLNILKGLVMTTGAQKKAHG